jgi:2Fe-2S ferredoxin
MPKITFLPNEDICPDGATIEVPKGTSICRAALDSGIQIEHACELSCACTTCHVYVVKGLSSLNDATDDEDDYLDKAWGLQSNSRLSCQAIIKDDDLVIEIPKYTINHASERH